MNPAESIAQRRKIPLLLLFLLLFLCPLFWFPMGAGAASTGGGGVHCPQWVNDEIQQCVQPVAEFAKALNRQQQVADQQSSSLSPSMSSAELGQALQWPTKLGANVFRDLCRLIGDFELCVEGYRDKCRRHITINLIEASYGFLCNEGHQTFMASAECLMELDQRPSVKQCHDRALRDIEQANRDQSGLVAPKLDKMCSALNFFSECVRQPIRQSCGRDAWRVIFRVLKDTTRTLMPMCQFEEEAEKEREEEVNKSKGKEEEEMGKMERTTTIGGWERWEEEDEEEEEDDGRDEDVREEDGRMEHHQIHYESAQPQNGAMIRWSPPVAVVLIIASFAVVIIHCTITPQMVLAFSKTFASE